MEKITRPLLPVTLSLLQIQAGRVQPQELPPSPPLRVALLVDLALGRRGSSRIPLVTGHQGNTQDLLQHLVGSPLVLGYLDNTHLHNTPLHRELRGSFPPALEPLGSTQGSTLGSFLGSTLGSFLGSTHLKELQDSYPEALFLTQLDHFLLALELPLGLIQMCLTQEVSQEEATRCTDLVVQVHSPLQLALVVSLHTPLEAFPPCPLGHGDPLQVEASLLPLAPLVLALGLWVRTVGLPLQEACCPDIIHHIIESNELNFSVGQGRHFQNQHMV